MNKVFKALRQAFEACLDIRILFFLFVPFLLAVIIGVILFFSVGALWLASAQGVVENSWVMEMVSKKWEILSEGSVSSISYFLSLLVALLIILPVSYLLAVLLVSMVLLPFILKILESKNFGGLEKKRGGSNAYSIWNTIKVSAVYLGGLVLSLPLWFFPGFAVVLPILLTSYLNKNLFVYDVLQDFASEEERKKIEKENWGLLYVLGIILGFINYLPLAFVVVPTFASLAYSYFCLNELKDLRENQPR